MRTTIERHCFKYNARRILVTPSEAQFQNNKSALKNSGFAQSSVDKMLSTVTVSECVVPPTFLNPISATNNS